MTPDEGPESVEEEPESTKDDVEEAEVVAEQSDEVEEKDAEQETLKSATDEGKAKRLARDNRARADAVSAILGSTTLAANIFVGNAIGLVEAGGPRSAVAVRGIVASGTVTEDELRSVASTFVKPDSYDHLLGRLRRQSVILLRAAPGWGRTTTALRLLNSECAQGVLKISPDASLRVPKELGLKAGRGHLLEWLDTDEAAQLHEFHLEQLKVSLDGMGGRMVVLLDPATEIREHALSGYVIDGGPPPESQAIVARHFQAYLEIAGKPEQRVSDFPEFADLVGTFALSARRVGNLAAFARDLGEVVLGRAGLEAIRSRYADTAEAAFREWFDGMADNDQRAFALALAVFNGMPMHAITVTATKLAKKMQAAENPDRRTRTRSIFSLRRSELVERAGAEVATASEDTDLGPLAAIVVKYHDDRRPRQLLEHVWREYDEAHQVVRHWLHELGASPDRRIRARAGVAVGLLGLSEFDHARQLVIEEWARANSHRELGAVLGALELPSRQPELQPLIVKMLIHWLKSGDAGLTIAAVQALGTFGIVSPGRALRWMRRAAGAQDSSFDVRYAIADSLVNLALIPGRLGQVMVAVLKWSDDLRIPVRGTGLMCSLQLASFLEVSTVDSVETWPALLHVAETDPDPQQPLLYLGESLSYRRAVVILLGRLLTAPFYMLSTYTMLRSWVATAQKDPAQRAPLGRLLADLAQETGDEKSLRHYLAEWATGRKNNAEAVAEILTVLDMKGPSRG